MLENPSDSSSTANISTVKRYAPPNQRNRSLGRRKSGGDKFERANIHVNDGERTQVAASRTLPHVVDYGDAGTSNLANENTHPKLITLRGCCDKRPVMYSGTGASAWGSFRLPHQLMSPTGSSGPPSGSQMDFLSELRRAMRNASAGPDT
ncbi:hypothetical protein RJ640_025278 [Escallonia rubra]|uniref:Uncharacterized protein n=1 Tax=Escallonia rubra TaxID=112253 RepID=A0AA88QHI0_9ASTE|nr:hypothetical protein RJ640_025278 [Escallonia rubra]